MYSIIEWKGQRKNNKWTETKRWKLTKPEQQRKNKLEKKKNRASESCRTVTRDLNVRVISISGREEKEDRAEKEIVPEIFPTLSKDTQETQQISVRMNPKKFTPRHIKVRLQKTEANFKKCWQLYNPQHNQTIVQFYQNKSFLLPLCRHLFLYPFFFSNSWLLLIWFLSLQSWSISIWYSFAEYHKNGIKHLVAFCVLFLSLDIMLLRFTYIVCVGMYIA